MDNLNEQILRAKELMGILNEQTDDFVCDECRWNGTKTYLLANDGSKTGMIELKLSLYNHTGSDTDRIERFDWEGNKSEERKGYRELEGKVKEANKKYKIDIEIPELEGFMLHERPEEE